MAANSKILKRILQAGAASAGVYGALVGANAESDMPKNMDEAQKTANPGNFTVNLAKDLAIGSIDDAAAFLFLKQKWFKKRFSEYRGLIDTAQVGLLFGGSAVAGAVAGHDFMNWIAAKQYISAHNARDLARSQAAVPDSRINPIPGFQSSGVNAQMRKQQTGIGSPAAGGIFYRMMHNPFAHQLQQTVNPPDTPQAKDPHLRALAYGWIGGHLGMAMGMRGGMGRAALFGLTAGVLAGGYGIYSSHNPDMRANFEAAGDVLLAAAPTTAMASVLYGLSNIGGGVGKTVTRALDAAVGYAGRAGESLRGFSQKTMPTAITKSKIGIYNALGDAPASVDAWWFARTGKQLKSPLAVEKVLDAAGSTTNWVNTVFDKNFVEMLRSTGDPSRTNLERNLGLAHLMVFAPHQAAIVMAAGSAIEHHNKRDRRKSLATGVLESNRL